MSKEKYYSLEDARKEGDFEQFAKEHPSTGDRSLFDKLLNAMVKDTSKKGEEPSDKNNG
jgi:hypothetical protein